MTDGLTENTTPPTTTAHFWQKPVTIGLALTLSLGATGLGLTGLTSWANAPVPPVPTEPAVATKTDGGPRYIAEEGTLKSDNDIAAHIVDGLNNPDDAMVRPANFLSAEDDSDPDVIEPIVEPVVEPAETSAHSKPDITITTTQTTTVSKTATEPSSTTDTAKNGATPVAPAAQVTTSQTTTTVTVATSNTPSAAEASMGPKPPAVSQPAFKDKSPLVYVQVPLAQYGQTGLIPAKLTEAAPVLKLIQQNANPALHLELMRRAAAEMPKAEQTKLIEGLQTFQRQANTDPIRMFPLGLAKVMLDDNQSGLYYLRKANDALQTPFTSLAYALAQTGIDIRHEGASPDERTLRKQEAMFRLNDAVTAHGQRPASGFWPVYVQAVNLLKPLGAYTEHVTSDPSTLMIPYGDSVSLAFSPAQAEEASAMAATEATTESKTPVTACALPKGQLSATEVQSAVRTLYVQADGAGTYETVYMWQHAVNGSDTPTYRMAVTKNGNILADLTTPKAPYVFEDLDSDHTPELVLRQFSTHPEEPIQVYRYNGCEYKPDTKISQMFQ